MELTGAQLKDGEGISAHVWPKYTWEVDKSWTKRKSPPHSATSLCPSIPFHHACEWMRKLRRVETNEARSIAGSTLSFLYYCLTPQLVSFQAVHRRPCFEVETVSPSDWLVVWSSPMAVCLSPQTQTDILPGRISNPAPWTFSYQTADQSEKTQGRHTERSAVYGPWPGQVEGVLPDPVLPGMLYP